MQVSALSDLDTHAVIGGSKPESFKITQSAEFFTVLSKTLYRDEKRAVIREVVCNAWDAHIKAGKTDLPVQIRITEDEIVVTDFGNGIPKGEVVDVYCTYGGSTKSKDSSQTGGFGLGSKAPFAYNDHFTVSICHIDDAGMRATYALSRGGTETEGRPDIRQMVETKAEHTGVTVTIPLRSAADAEEFRKITKSLVLLGDINATLNGEQLRRLPYTDADAGVIQVPHGVWSESRLAIKYGAVVYPLTTSNSELSALIAKASQFAQGGALILEAPAGSISVTPSREALSYNDRTIETVTALLQRLINRLEALIPAARRRVCERAVEGFKASRLKSEEGTVSHYAIQRLAEEAMHVLKLTTYAGNHSYTESQKIADIAERVAYARKTTPGQDLQLVRSAIRKGVRGIGSHVRRIRLGKHNYLSALRVDNRLLLRFVGKLDLHANLFTQEYDRNYPFVTRFVHLDPSEPIYIGPSHAAIRKLVDPLKGSDYRRVIVLKTLGAEKRAQMVELAKTYGLNLVIDAYAKPVRVKRTKDQFDMDQGFYSLAQYKTAVSAEKLLKLERIQESRPIVHLGCVAPFTHSMRSRHLNRLNLVCRLGLEEMTAVPMTEAELKALVDAGVPDIFAYAENRLAEILKTRSGQYAAMIENRRLFATGLGRERLHEIACQNTAAALILAPARGVSVEEVDAARAYMSSLLFSNSNGDLSTFSSKAWLTVSEAAQASSIRQQPITDKYKFISLLNQKLSDSKDFIDAVKVLLRAGAKQAA